jgi:hypothetical protein
MNFDPYGRFTDPTRCCDVCHEPAALLIHEKVPGTVQDYVKRCRRCHDEAKK